MIMLNVHRIIKSTAAEGPGIRTCIWLQGCSRHCKGCFAEDTWSFEPHELKSVDELLSIILSDKNSEGVTILGGEPLEQVKELTVLLRKVRAFGLSVIVFTGFCYDLIKEDETFCDLLNTVDVLIDGEYVEEQKDFTRPLVGSSNQRFIFLTNRYTEEDFQPNKIEIRIRKTGEAIINGQGKTSYFEKHAED